MSIVDEAFAAVAPSEWSGGALWRAPEHADVRRWLAAVPAAEEAALQPAPPKRERADAAAQAMIAMLRDGVSAEVVAYRFGVPGAGAVKARITKYYQRHPEEAPHAD